MNRQQWFSVWGFDHTHPSLETALHRFCTLPDAAVKVPPAIVPRALRPASRNRGLSWGPSTGIPLSSNVRRTAASSHQRSLTRFRTGQPVRLHQCHRTEAIVWFGRCRSGASRAVRSARIGSTPVAGSEVPMTYGEPEAAGVMV